MYCLVFINYSYYVPKFVKIGNWDRNKYEADNGSLFNYDL